jgi:hypothetical protein
MKTKSEIKNKIAKIMAMKGMTIVNHPECPVCGSENTKQITDHGACLCGCDCWSHPECLDCGYEGYMNSEGIYWQNHDVIRWLKDDLKQVKK